MFHVHILCLYCCIRLPKWFGKSGATYIGPVICAIFLLWENYAKCKLPFAYVVYPGGNVAIVFTNTVISLREMTRMFKTPSCTVL